jgi:hypothetical protein
MAQTLTNKPAPYIIDQHKIEKYLPKLINGEAYKLETWLPNLLSTGGLVDREKYDWRTTQFRKKDPSGYNTKINQVIQQLETIKQNKQLFINALAELKTATDQHHEKTRTDKY